MVRSGLEDFSSRDPKVSPTRLTLHFSCALALYTVLLSAIVEFKIKPVEISKPFAKFIKYYKFGTLLLAITAISGSLVAGSRAGKIYDMFPKMGEGYIPSDYYQLSSKDLNLKSFFLNTLYNPTAIQFHHRVLVN